jgi:hypothetical protein
MFKLNTVQTNLNEDGAVENENTNKGEKDVF